LFRANHPQWRPPAESRALVSNLRQFADRRLGVQPTGAGGAAGDADDETGFDGLMQASLSLQRDNRAAAPLPARRNVQRNADVDPMEALSDVIEQYHAERAAAAPLRVDRERDDDDVLDDSADFNAGPVRPLDV
jgi:hypothetical protein